MSVASHLGIKLAEYDSRIRTFIPHYEEMLDVAAAAVLPSTRTIVDLGVGTGALSARCQDKAPRARTVGIDLDPAILEMARKRLGERATLVAGSFLRAPLPPCDAVVTSFALHHIRTRAAKAAMFRRIRAALEPRGLFISVDSCPAADPVLRRSQIEEWHAHLRRTYSAKETTSIFRGWSHEDVYMPLDAELSLIRAAGFRTELLWRRGAFSVIRAAR